ncbi:MAG: response regulator [Ignavibacteria bacterium]|nr:response regulator [Ignavibacteria bacterium]
MEKILIVDDQKDTLVILREYLKKENFTVFTAESSKDALLAVEEQKPDLILLDIMMPDVNGLELAHMLTLNQETAHIPIIFISARITPEDVRTGFQAGAVDYIKKPINKIELVERVRSVIKRTQELREVVKLEKVQTFTATAVAANHKLKQPLTLINLSISALKRILNKNDYNKDELMAKIETIQVSVNQIAGILNNFLHIENPELNSYLGDIKMVDVDAKKNEQDKN